MTKKNKHTYKLLPLLIFFFSISCSKDVAPSKYLRWVGDSKFDATTDSEAFKPCRGDKNVLQYFNFSDGLVYEGEKRAIDKHFQDNYHPIDNNQTGWIRIRFIVNCKGQTGRFRLTASDENYQPTTFDTQITDQLLALTKELNGWVIQSQNNIPRDYYQYQYFSHGIISSMFPAFILKIRYW
ncbi:MAG: hypothetical protein AAFO07_31115 [Bacteroidota bacterium]